MVCFPIDEWLIQRRAKIGENREKQAIYDTKRRGPPKTFFFERASGFYFNY
jgi:hypothetical protein